MVKATISRKRKPGSFWRPKEPSRSIIFKRKRYYLYSTTSTKGGAQKEARKLLGLGYKVRIMRAAPFGFALYSSPAREWFYKPHNQ